MAATKKTKQEVKLSEELAKAADEISNAAKSGSVSE